MTPKVTLRRALEDDKLLGRALSGESWANWRALLLAIMGERLNPTELQRFRTLTGRYAPLDARVDEFWGVIGRRGGKSRAIATLASFIATLIDHSAKLTTGERGVVLLIAPDQRQAKVLLDYVNGILEDSPLLKQMIVRRTADTLDLTNGISIEVRAASFRRLRGVTTIAVIADEAAFWLSDDASANADSEILNAVRPSLATTGGLLAVISSPHAKRGEVWQTFRRHFGAEGDPRVLIAQATSREMNSTLPQSVVDRALARDHAAASAEYLAQFRNDVAAFVSFEVVDGCVDSDAVERPPETRYRYFAFTDPSGGSSDAMTLAIGHRDGAQVVIDAVREVRPPFSPESTVNDFSNLLQSYRVRTVFGDRYAGEWPREQFRKRGISYAVSPKPKSDLFRDLLPLLNASTIILPKNDRLVSQLVGLERRVSRSGRDSIDHGPGQHDDLANAVAGVASIVGTYRPPVTQSGHYSHGNGPEPYRKQNIVFKFTETL
jgi:hypothetical protein